MVKQQTSIRNCARVNTIILEIGQLAAVEKEALTFGFNVIREGTVAEHAVLHIIDVPGEAICEECHNKVPLRQYYDACQHCGSHQLKVTQGEELRIKSMVVE